MTEIQKCKEFFLINPTYQNVNFSDLKIREKAIYCNFPIVTRIINLHKIDLLNITTASQNSINSLKFNCEDIQSIVSGKNIGDNDLTEVRINTKSNKIDIINGHHRLCWLKLLAMNKIIKREILVGTAHYYHVDNKLNAINKYISIYFKNKYKNPITTDGYNYSFDSMNFNNREDLLEYFYNKRKFIIKYSFSFKINMLIFLIKKQDIYNYHKKFIIKS